MSTVGYGDEKSMPNLDTYSSDIWIFTTHILASIFGFSLCNASFTSLIDSFNDIRGNKKEYV